MDKIHAKALVKAIYCIYLRGFKAMNQKTALFVVVIALKRMVTNEASSSINV